ncbi:MAG TPA: radical SAM protein [Tepidisphaeraceae bacterium]|nr:radical SAM protein [Tepidisphaeraceae bacterium]
MGRFDHRQYVELTMHFACNLKCEHCMIEGTMDRLEPQSMDKFQEVLDFNRRTGTWKGIIFTGSEVTLRKDLPELARTARRYGFEHVRIQTHGMHLSNPKYCADLVAAGIDEYFVSVTAADAATHDEITQVPGSFDRTLRGLENLDQFEHVTTLTNSVVTRKSYQQLPALVARLAGLRQLVQMDFWNYWPMSETDTKDLVVSHTDVLPFLREAILLNRKIGRDVEVKNFPECLLGELSWALNNDQPKLFIDPSFWPEFMRNGFAQCVHRDRCGSRKCLGLNTAYVKKFGWQPEALHPLPMSGPVAAPARRNSIPLRTVPR